MGYKSKACKAQEKEATVVNQEASVELFFDRDTLPVLHTCDVAVVGGSFAGVTTALALARAGRRVVLVEPRTYLGREITATLRPWVRVPAGAKPSSLPEALSACIQASGTSAQAGEAPLHVDAVKLRLEDMILAAGVKLIYASLPVGLCTDGGGVQGVIIGNKSGRQVIRCAVVVDATVTALVARLAGAAFEPPPEDTALFSYTLEFTGVDALEGTELPVPQCLGLSGDKLVLHRGYRGMGHNLLEYELALPSKGSDPLAVAQRDALARKRTTALAEYLMAEVPPFDGVCLASSSYELDGPHTTRMAGPVPEWARRLEPVILDVGTSGKAGKIAATAFAGPIRGLWCLNESVRVDVALQPLIDDPVVSSRLGTALGRAIADHWESAGAASAVVPKAEPSIAAEEATTASKTERLRIKEQEHPQRGRDYELVPAVPSPVTVLDSADVLVIGGGSSGAVAGIVSGQQGMETVLVDMNPGLGGTETFGGVDSYWMGARDGFISDVIGWVAGMHDRLRHPRPEGLNLKWNILAKTWALMEAAEDAGIEMLMNALAFATIVEGNAVRGVVVATRTGPVALLGKMVIDASGDGDVAAFAGADYVYGSGRDHVASFYSLHPFGKPGRTHNDSTSMVDVSNVEDYTRAILAGRRRGIEGAHDHAAYLAPRESRHIVGDVVLTLTDTLVRRCWRDVIGIAFSHNDQKTQSGSDWVRIGLLPPNLEIEIPYRALVPRHLDNILVVGKAYSATMDALATVRMQPDLENLGGVAAVAATMALASGKTFRYIDVSVLQAKLVEGGVLPERILGRSLVERQYTDEQLGHMLDDLTNHLPLHTYSNMEINERYDGRIPLVDLLCAGPRVVPMLEQTLEETEALGQTGRPRQVLLAQALALLGSKAGAPVLISAIQGQLDGNRLPKRTSFRRWFGYPPTGNAAPDVACLVYSLGLTRDCRALPIWQRIVDLLATATKERVFDRYESLYYYVTSVCYGAERLGDPDAVPVLMQLHSYSPFQDQVSRSGFQADFLKERQAYLELLVGRALARCGSPEGFLILINYLDDVRTLLAEHAHTELVAIAGADLGKNMAAWGQWLEREGEELGPVPWIGPTDPVAAWEEKILIEG